MVRYGSLNADLVWESLSGPADHAWRGWEAAVGVFRTDDPAAFTQFENLVLDMRRYGAKRRPG